MSCSECNRGAMELMPYGGPVTYQVSYENDYNYYQCDSCYVIVRRKTSLTKKEWEQVRLVAKAAIPYIERCILKDFYGKGG